MTASRQWRERTLYLFCGGFQGGRDRRGREYSPPKITVKRASWARGLRPRPQFAPSQGRKGFRGRGRIGVGFPPKCFSLFPSFSLPLPSTLTLDPSPFFAARRAQIFLRGRIFSRGQSTLFLEARQGKGIQEWGGVGKSLGR